ncbi:MULTISPECIES: LysR family transcriptional regulator [Clostridium]|uniref:LysR family transcriptional regulator n=1 Tax=Clostridium TaxID=1485 RepID=UPI0008271C42|nr:MULTISPECIES: LysR family transcriptional regulator [Clostridium]PJI08646.1 LysR family transcriptional regulator [Clostridium sp. CT7]
MEIRHLQTFVTVVDKNGFTKAADHLGYAQSTITAHVQKLEDELGQPLFDRLGKKIVVTDFGKQLLPYAREMLKIYNEINNAAFEKDQIKGKIVIGASESLCIYRLDKAIKRYKEQFPKVNIVLKNSICSDLRRRLYTGEFDLVFTIEPYIVDDNLVVKKLKEEKMVIASGSHNIEDNSIIFSEERCSCRISFERYLKYEGIKYTNPLELSSIEAIKRCIINGLGLSLMPLYSIRDEVESGIIKTFELHKNFEKYSTWLIYHKNKKIFPAMQKFMQVVLDDSKEWR